MRKWLAIVLAAMVLAPGVAAAQILSSEEAGNPEFRAINAHPAECSRLRRQIDHFRMMQRRAEVLDNELWADRMNGHLELLYGMQAARCPGDIPVDTAAEAWKQLIKLAAKGALTYFTMGAAGF